MGRRLPLSAALACLVTFGLFWTMQALIGVSGTLKEGRPPPSIEFVRLRKDTTPEAKKREPPKREKPEQAPPPPNISMSKASFEPGDAVADYVPEIDASEALSGGIGGGGGADRDIVPLVRISPEYPMRARQREIEGWATVGFTISKAGTVKEAHIVGSQPGKVFDSAALNAVRKWKYNPKIEQGKAVERTGVRVTLAFSMED
jgi:protein TonB